MYSRVKLFGRPIHPMLVGFPLALYWAALLSFIFYAKTADFFWVRCGVAANLAALVMGALAGLSGFLDWILGVPSDTSARDTATWHFWLNLAAYLVFAFNGWIGSQLWGSAFAVDPTFPIILAAI